MACVGVVIGVDSVDVQLGTVDHKRWHSPVVSVLDRQATDVWHQAARVLKENHGVFDLVGDVFVGRGNQTHDVDV